MPIVAATGSLAGEAWIVETLSSFLLTPKAVLQRTCLLNRPIPLTTSTSEGFVATSNHALVTGAAPSCQLPDT